MWIQTGRSNRIAEAEPPCPSFSLPKRPLLVTIGKSTVEFTLLCDTNINLSSSSEVPSSAGHSQKCSSRTCNCLGEKRVRHFSHVYARTLKRLESEKSPRNTDELRTKHTITAPNETMAAEVHQFGMINLNLIPNLLHLDLFGAIQQCHSVRRYRSLNKDFRSDAQKRSNQ